MWDILVFRGRANPDMKRKRYFEEKMISILKAYRAGALAAYLSRHHGLAENNNYCWKAKYGGMQAT